MSRPTLFTDEFLLWSICKAWEHANGERPQLAPEDSLWRLFTGDAEDDDEIAFFFAIHLQRLLGIDVNLVELFPPVGNLPIEVWRAEVAPRVTVGDLMAYLRERAPDVSFAPLDLPGAAGCDAAGWFLGIRDTLAATVPNVPGVAPSMPIRRVVRGTNLMKVWERLHGYTRGQLPVPKSRTRELGNWFVALAIFCGICAVGCEFLQPGAGWLMFGVFWGFKCFGAGRWLRERAVPLPPQVETFGDLARYAARVAPMG